MFSMCRHLYNWSLGERINAYETETRTVSYTEQQNRLPQLKKDRPWFKGVHSQVLQDVLNRLDKAYKAFFSRVASGSMPGFPKFKKRGQWRSITYPQYYDRPQDSRITVPKLGDIEIVYHRDIPAEASVKTLTITKDGGKWYACFSFEMDHSDESKRDILKAVGIDLGLIDFYYTSDGGHISVPKYLRKQEERLKVLQRRFSHEAKHTPRYYKLLRALQKVHSKIKNQRRDFLHKRANELLAGADLIVHEDLNIAGMKRRPRPKQDEDGTFLPNGASRKAGLNKSISDAGWGMFLGILRYKAEALGITVAGVNPRWTSQLCSQCGTMVEKALSTRTHLCPECGYDAPRDENAAKNILRLGLESLGLDPIEAPAIASS
jgi:putative transposase